MQSEQRISAIPQSYRLETLQSKKICTLNVNEWESGTRLADEIQPAVSRRINICLWETDSERDIEREREVACDDEAEAVAIDRGSVAVCWRDSRCRNSASTSTPCRSCRTASHSRSRHRRLPQQPLPWQPLPINDGATRTYPLPPPKNRKPSI
jgi:hypothetical protein